MPARLLFSDIDNIFSHSQRYRYFCSTYTAVIVFLSIIRNCGHIDMWVLLAIIQMWIVNKLYWYSVLPTFRNPIKLLLSENNTKTTQIVSIKGQYNLGKTHRIFSMPKKAEKFELISKKSKILAF